ncbi:hypothetical protein C0J52_23822, partial [Blattella germanica]
TAADVPSTDVDELRRNFRAVTEVNKQWQKYNNDRQLYVQCLLSTIQDQQEKINCIVEKRVFPSSCSEDEGSRVTENARLREEVALLRKQLEQKDQEHKEHIAVLEFQVKAHRDDWEAERTEKQQALKDKEALEQRVRELENHGRLQSREKACCDPSLELDKSDKEDLSYKKILRSRSCSLEEPQSVHQEDKLQPAGLENAEHRYSCSVLHISPTASGSSLESEESSITSSGVTIGFSSNGLASVTSFSERPVVKSSSMPISDSHSALRPTFSQWSLDSGWASVVGPPLINRVSRNTSEEKSFTMMKSKNLTKSENNVTVNNVRKTSVPWKAKYFEDGIATETREDVVCPGCGQVFPPDLHLEFLDHFELCQKSAKDSSKKKCNAIHKSRN